MMKNKWLLAGLGLIIIIGLYFWLGYKKVEYSEMADGPHLRGNPEASVVLVEYSDFQCPACGNASFLVKDLLDKYQDQIRFEYRHFPLTSIHPYAFRAAEAAECAADQGKFWELHDQIFLNQDKLRKKDLIVYAAGIEGLDSEIWQDCLASGAKSNRVKEDLNEANQLGYNSTPTFVLNGQKITNYNDLPSRIEGLLQPLIPLQQATSSQSYFRNVKFSS